jgi:hypothetical protein
MWRIKCCHLPDLVQSEGVVWQDESPLVGGLRAFWVFNQPECSPGQSLGEKKRDRDNFSEKAQRKRRGTARATKSIFGLKRIKVMFF